MRQQWCCICGSQDGVAFCEVCRHNFCESHRSLIGGSWRAAWERGAAAVSQWLTRNPPQWCFGHEREEGSHEGV